MFRPCVLCFALVALLFNDVQSAETGPSSDLLKLFRKLDELGQFHGEPLTLLELSVSMTDHPEHKWSEKVWLVKQDEASITVRKHDFLPWKYDKTAPTVVPSSWHPKSVKVESVKEVDLLGFFRDQSIPEKKDDDGHPIRSMSEFSGPSHRCLLAFMAWKHGHPEFCEQIIQAASDTPDFKTDFSKYEQAVLTDLAWLHYLRGVNLLMYADRREVLPHLRRAAELSPESEHAVQARQLLASLEKLVANQSELPEIPADERSLTDDERVRFYVSQIKDLRCPQMAQPGFIEPYLAVRDGKPEQDPPTAKLKAMGMKAVPHLIVALKDDTPTRTVYHWRDFAHSRLVWRVSDFAWHLIRDITKKEFGYRRTVGFTLSSMTSDQKRQTVADIEKWHAENKDLPADDQMFNFFSSRAPEDWIAAGEYFLKQKNNRAVAPLLKLIPQADDFSKGDLCELVAKFQDRSAVPALKTVMASATEHSDRLNAAIGLWTLGDPSGIPVAVAYVKAADQPYGSWDEPIWFLMRTRSKEAIEAIRSVVLQGSTERASEVIGFVSASITGHLHGERREPAGCVEIVPVLMAALNRAEFTGGLYNDTKVRIKDEAAQALVLLRDGTEDPFPGIWPTIDSKHFDITAPQESVRDKQIEVLKDWFATNADKLAWSSEKRRLVLKEGNPN